MSGGFWVAGSLVHHGLGDSWVPRSWFPRYKLHQFVAFWHIQIPHWSWGNEKGEKKNPIGFFFWSCNPTCSGSLKPLKPSWDRVMFCGWFEDGELGTRTIPSPSSHPSIPDYGTGLASSERRGKLLFMISWTELNVCTFSFIWEQYAHPSCNRVV